MRSALIVDVHNLYLGIQNKYPGRSLDYAELIKDHECQTGSRFLFKIAYGRQAEGRVDAFAKVLRNLGFDIRFGGAPYAIDLAVTVAEMIERRAIDQLVLGSVALETIPLLQYVRNHGVFTTIAGFNVPARFGNYGYVHDLDEQFIMLRSADTNNLPPDSTGSIVKSAA